MSGWSTGAVAAPDDLRAHLLGPRPIAEAPLAETAAGPVGFVLFFHIDSTFRGRPGLYLEDSCVRPEHRGRGIGKALDAGLLRLAGFSDVILETLIDHGAHRGHGDKSGRSWKT